MNGSPAALLGPGTRATAAVRLALGVAALVVFVVTDLQIVANVAPAVDVRIPLAATERWLAGEPVYLAASFTEPAIYGQPFLYPPFVLPFLVPLTAIPEEIVRVAGLVLTLLAAVAISRRLAIPWLLLPGVLLWEPMFGGIWGANVQMLLVAAFVAAFWIAPSRHDLHPAPRDLERSGAVTPRIGWYAATVASVKATQIHAWLAVASRAPRAAIVGASPWAIVALVTLPIVGTALYVDWLAQLSRASDPSWAAMGPSLLKYLPAWTVAALTLVSLVLAVRLRGPDTGAWLGILMLLVAPNMHDFNGLLLLPALLRIRREFALLAALLTSTATAEGWWLGIAIVVVAMLAGRTWPEAYEPPANRP
jgi:hypothetical protein